MVFLGFAVYFNPADTYENYTKDEHTVLPKSVITIIVDFACNRRTE